MTMTDCASCADERAAGAAFCEACGRSLAAETTDPAASAATGPTMANPAGTPCPNCGASGGVGADGYCENCGMLAGRPRDHVEADCGTVAASVTDRGKRHHRNEDAMFLAVRGQDVDVVVCDGVSASFDPDVASETAAGTAGAQLVASPDVSAAILAAKAAVAALVTSGDPRRTASNPACTIVAATVRGAEINVGWVGDSRAYWLPPEGPAEQLTEDDSWATHVIAMGADPESAMRDPKAHAITAWLGADAAPVLPRTGAFTVVGSGHLILCSDGLWNYLTDHATFAETVRTCLREGGTLVEAARRLVAFANDAGGADNITVALVPVSSDPADIPAETVVKE
jgi:PPM family protein phosphatase